MSLLSNMKFLYLGAIRKPNSNWLAEEDHVGHLIVRIGIQDRSQVFRDAARTKLYHPALATSWRMVSMNVNSITFKEPDQAVTSRTAIQP